MRFCVRSSLGYMTSNTTNNVTYNEYFQEVNFIESLVTVFYDLSAGFCIASFNVEPKERVETTVQEDTYGLEAWLCDPDLQPFTARLNPSRIVPQAIADSYLADKSVPSNATYFNQGALITVCVAPDDFAYGEGIRMDGITTFNWKRDDYGLIQPAIFNSGPSANFLTAYNHAACVGAAEWCTFSTILFADFYINTGLVYGEGRANLKFAYSRRNRRLGAEGDAGEERSRRKLQEQDEKSSFDVTIGVNDNGAGRASLKTAGGPSATTSFAVLISVMSLFGAALLA